MRQPRNDFRGARLSAWLLVLCAGPAARAGEIWTWTHEGAGQGTANVFDGGPVVTASSTSLPGSSGVGFAAVDRTRTGSQAASYSTAGSSRIDEYLDDDLLAELLRVEVRFSTGYTGGFTSHDDHTGGEGGGSIWSVVEFVMPKDELTWLLRLLITDTAGFDGSTHVKFENVTQGVTLRELTSPVVFTETLKLSGHTGDVIRITSQMEGEGFFPPQVTLGLHTYNVNFESVFIVPEPSTIALVLAGVALIGTRGRRF